jgi:Raf kinase inhibitor-like YbhB/YbcL family protein
VDAALGVDDRDPAAGRVARRRPLLVLALALVVAGCGGSGASAGPEVTSAAPAATSAGLSTGPVNASPVPASSAPAASVAPSSPTATEAPVPTATFKLTTSAFPAGGSIPPRFTCDGADISPDLAWSGAPAGTAALVLLVDDPDASGFVHWIVLDLAGADSGTLPRGDSASPVAHAQGTNDFGTVGWRGPCPPSGEHRYRFTLSALAAPLGLTGAPDGKAVRAALKGAKVLGTATLEGRYRRH